MSENLRKAMINYVWGVDVLPSGMPASVTNTTDARFSNLENIKFILVGLALWLELENEVI